MDINIVIKKSVIYAYASLLLLIPLTAIIVLLQQFFFKDINWWFAIASFCVMFIAAYVFQFAKTQAEKQVEQYIFKNKYDYKKTISDLSRAMVSILDIHELSREIITTTTQAMRVNKASIFIFDEEDGCYKLYDSIGLGDTDDIKRYPKDNPLFKWVGERDEIVIREELERYSSASTTLAVIETLKMMGSELCLPLVTKQKLIGIINLGMKGKGEMYTHEDLELLETMANQATVAIENARLYEDLIRAKVQMQRADRLAALGTLTAGLAHEIRNPLVAIKTFTQLLPTRFDDTEFRDHFLKVTAGEVDRIASLVTELLDFARPSQPKLNSEDLNQVVEKMALLVDTESHKKNIKILKDLYASLPFVTLDKEQIKQVLLNILLNAVDATPENGTISVSTRPLTKNGYLDHVQVTIADTGKGIPEEDLEKVFTPFYTTKHTGSGLGLSISHQIVQEHQGNIEVESKLNVGTTFRINLPVNPSLTEKGRQRRSSDEKNVSH
jgi:signal transduction histidine kinase